LPLPLSTVAADANCTALAIPAPLTSTIAIARLPWCPAHRMKKKKTGDWDSNPPDEYILHGNYSFFGL
jgi:hypothetical protein